MMVRSYCWSNGRWYIFVPSPIDTLHLMHGYLWSGKFSIIRIPSVSANCLALSDSAVDVQKVPVTVSWGWSIR